MKPSKRNPHYMPENALLNVSGKAAMLCLLSAVAKEILNWPLKNPLKFHAVVFIHLKL